MRETEQIADQLRRAYEGEAWHGPSLKEILADVTAKQAAARPVAGAHSIWEIVRHIAAWEGIVLRRMGGAVVKNVGTEVDWPPVRETSVAAWQRTLKALQASNRKLRTAIAKMTDQRLRARVPGKEASFYGELHGIVQHDLYHAGQIALLKKALG
ncbi:MAG: DinB family protein [Acidobacteria bacterium]|nr:DinB family protein [Acidobacteriota bacterium]MCL5286953.1 DinB family protein [Acidobacteriota bacterium]